jgi:hypothetical protein
VKYCFDTSALIEPWIRLYPPDVLGPVWEKLEDLIASGIVRAPHEVLIELSNQLDALHDWALGNAEMFVPPDAANVAKMKEIINAHPGLIKAHSTKSMGDPWVIALAEINKVPVVQYENKGKKNGAPKIPDVCSARGITCLTLIDVLRAEGFKL